MQSTITIEQANQKVEDYSVQIRQALPAEAQYEISSSEKAGTCTDPSDNGPKSRVLASRTYKVLGLPKDKIPGYFDALRAWWQNHDFRVLDNTPPNEFLWVENNADGFRMTAKSNIGGELYLIATSPCVWPDGTPEPQAAADQPAHEPAIAQDQPAVPVVVPKPAQARRPQRAPAEETEDFDQTDWTSES